MKVELASCKLHRREVLRLRSRARTNRGKGTKRARTPLRMTAPVEREEI